MSEALPEPSPAPETPPKGETYAPSAPERCPCCGALLKAVPATFRDEDGEVIDYEGYLCPRGCRIEEWM